MLKIMTVVGTRPEIIRLSRTIDCLDRYTDHVLIHTGQNFDYELNQVFFSQLKIRAPDLFLNAAGSNAAETIGNVIVALDKALATIAPDAVLILGDTNSALSVIAAKRRKIPIFHMEAGNRCFDQRVPEEINRKIVDHLADINLTYSEIAKNYLIDEGFPKDRAICIGSPMKEVLDFYLEEALRSPILDTLNLCKKHYFLVSLHREENVDSPDKLKDALRIFENLVAIYDFPVIVSTHPRTRLRIEALEMQVDERVIFCKPFGYLDYLNLQLNAKCVLSDSGTISEESSILNFPAINLREMHERPEAMEEASVMFTGLKLERILQCLSILEDQKEGAIRTIALVKDYDVNNVSEKVVRIILSYTDYVNRTVWKKY